MTWTTRPRSELGGLAAITAGTGPNLLLLHGVGLWAEAWGAQLDALPACIAAPDMAGHGPDPRPVGAGSLEEYVQAALAALTALDGPAVVVGHSMGAMLGLELAMRAPDRVQGVAALNAVFERSPEAAGAVQARAAVLDGVNTPDPEPTLTRWFGRDASPARAACGFWLRTVDPAAYKQAYTAFAHSGLPSPVTLASIRCPALFMTGSLEPNSTPAMSRAMADLAPNGRAIVVEGAAHMMPMTHADDVNTALTALLTEVSQ